MIPAEKLWNNIIAIVIVGFIAMWVWAKKENIPISEVIKNITGAFKGGENE